MELPNSDLKGQYNSAPDKFWTFKEIRDNFEVQGGGWIFDLAIDKILKSYGSIPPRWDKWLTLIRSFLDDQGYFAYQVKEFGRELAERQYDKLFKEAEDAYTMVIADFSEININKTRKILLENFDCVTQKERDTQGYFDEFEVFYESMRREKIVETDLFLKFRLELKKRLFSDNIALTDTPIEKVIQLTHPQISLLHIYTYKSITKNNAQEIAQIYGQSSGQKLFDTYKKMAGSLTERISSKYSIRDVEKCIDLLSDPNHLDRARDELRQAKTLKGIDQ